MKRFVAVLAVYVISLSAWAQEKDPVLLTVGGNEVKLSEFTAIFNKNKTDQQVSEEAVNEYLDLYIKFKLKVREAEELGYDTLPKFKNELKGYRAQLAKPYLTDKDVTEGLIKEAYERMKQDVRASHIMIALDPEAYDNDTIEAYKKIMAARKRVLNGEDFGKVAKEVSEDPSAQKNNGDLGYFSAMHMVYPFESAAYNTKVGEVSMPVRSRFGYHIIKVVDKRPARGIMKAAHIMVKTTKLQDAATEEEIKAQEAKEKKKIDEIYERLKSGDDFAAMAAQYSDDKASSARGGELPEFNAGKMVPEFEDAAFSLKNDGDFSAPFKTEYGWHIVKRLALKELDSYDVIYNTLKARVSRDSRSNKSELALLEKIKVENNFKEDLKRRDDFYKLISAQEMKDGTWDPAKAKKYTKLMFGFYAPDGDKLEFTQPEFADLMAKRRLNDQNKDVNVKSEINRVYKRQVYNMGIQFKDSRLEKTNQEFRLLMQEYRDGILLFDLTDEKVWSKAVKDTAGLEAFYEQNKTNYMWSKRVDATLYKCNDEIVASSVEKILKKKAKKGYTNDDILKMVNTDSELSLTIETGKYEKGSNDQVDKATWEKGVQTRVANGKGTTIVVINDVMEPQPKSLDEIRGLITSDYQNYLEAEWVKALKVKYTVVVDKEVLKLVK
ncbi:MAG: peptidylprolyl isomerase [Flavobacteriales bacterium]|nr:peptidylprolyl isomerase [Flavobacteriales bacterium]